MLLYISKLGAFFMRWVALITSVFFHNRVSYKSFTHTSMEGNARELPNKGAREEGMSKVIHPPFLPPLWALPQKNSHRNFYQVSWDIHCKFLCRRALRRKSFSQRHIYSFMVSKEVHLNVNVLLQESRINIGRLHTQVLSAPFAKIEWVVHTRQG